MYECVIVVYFISFNVVGEIHQSADIFNIQFHKKSLKSFSKTFINVQSVKHGQFWCFLKGMFILISKVASRM